jgi:hypothetical protein
VLKGGKGNRLWIKHSYRTGACPVMSFQRIVHLYYYQFFFFCSTGAWTQGLHLEPLHQPFFVIFFFFEIRVLWITCLGWLRTLALLISASWVAGITNVNHWHLTNIINYFLAVVGIELSLVLAREVRWHLGHFISPFYIGYFWDRVMFNTRVSIGPCDGPICVSPHIW